MPTEILAEQRRLPMGFLEEMIEARCYAATKAQFEYDPKEDSDMLRLVKEITEEIHDEDMEAAER